MPKLCWNTWGRPSISHAIYRWQQTCDGISFVYLSLLRHIPRTSKHKIAHCPAIGNRQPRTYILHIFRRYCNLRKLHMTMQLQFWLVSNIVRATCSVADRPAMKELLIKGLFAVVFLEDTMRRQESPCYPLLWHYRRSFQKNNTRVYYETSVFLPRRRRCGSMATKGHACYGCPNAWLLIDAIALSYYTVYVQLRIFMITLEKRAMRFVLDARQLGTLLSWITRLPGSLNKLLA